MIMEIAQMDVDNVCQRADAGQACLTIKKERMELWERLK